MRMASIRWEAFRTMAGGQNGTGSIVTLFADLSREMGDTLLSGNAKHFKEVPLLAAVAFKA